uniref:Uncharacterized protein n=1 Tax=Myoviridae sp. ctCo31 TaxID=2825053 RepID=A0A8S5UMK6_9CAUD|nr:MAG TPA: hypothetical protein [Myoviridae sp. ctCo31]
MIYFNILVNCFILKIEHLSSDRWTKLKKFRFSLNFNKE